MVKKSVVRIAFGTIITAFLALSVSAVTMAWFMGFGGSTQSNVHGDIGLRGYYHAGDGTTVETAYEITKPNHFYNLARLQNRGVYPEKRFFRIGHVFDENEGPVCLDDNGNHVKVLDMTSYCADKKLPPIGAEGTPFHGTIEGNGIPIVGLEVEANPEDVGVFGYVAHDGLIENMIFKDVKVSSLGYSNSSTAAAEDYSDDLFDRSIDQLFLSSATLFNKAELFWVSTLSDDPVVIEANKDSLKNTSGYPMNDINAPSNMVKDQNNDPTTTVIGYFDKLDPPEEEGKPFTYSWHSSSDLIRPAKINGKEVMVLDLESLTTGQFNSGGRVKCNARLSLTANTVYQGVRYSRVIQSYNCEFYSNAKLYSEGQFSMIVFCDYSVSTPGAGDAPTNYHHGYNVGILAGHVDGTMNDCYVYNGELHLNSESGNTHISSESETGLIGEIGVNVHTPIKPDYGEKYKGEEGVMNFSGIYATIRRNFQKGDTASVKKESPARAKAIKSGGTVIGVEDDTAGATISSISYDAAKTGTGQFSKFSQYLRRDNSSTTNYLTYVGSEASGDALDTQTLTVANTATNSSIRTSVEGATVGLNADTFVSRTNDTVGGIFHFVYNGTAWIFDDESVNLSDYGITFNLGTGTLTPSSTITVETSFKTNADKYNSVDFLWNQVIEDEDDVSGGDRGLGVFKIVTQFNEAYKWMVEHNRDPVAEGYYLDGIGKTRIINGSRKTKVYYSTAECDWTKGDGWTGEGSVNPLKATTIPSYSTVDSFEYPFSRDFNYVFELDLAEANKPAGKNYFYNAKGFLLNYLESILIDEEGTRLTPVDERFGFMMRDYLGNDIDNLSAYMPIGNPGSFSSFMDKDVEKQYPSNCIVFKIDNDEGANVSVVGSENDISIYRNWKNDLSNKPAGVDNLQELYTMRSRKVDDIDSFRFFPYTLHATSGDSNPTSDPVSEGTGVIVPQEGEMRAGELLIGHTFRLPRGDYVLGSSKKTAKDKNAKVYYLAVQGQDDASLGKTTEAYMGQAVEGVDFLLNDPYPSTPPEHPLAYVAGQTTAGGVALQKAELSFTADFNTGSGAFYAKKHASLDCIQFTFNNGDTATVHLMAYCRKETPLYYFNSIPKTGISDSWPDTTGSP